MVRIDSPEVQEFEKSISRRFVRWHRSAWCY